MQKLPQEAFAVPGDVRPDSYVLEAVSKSTALEYFAPPSQRQIGKALKQNQLATLNNNLSTQLFRLSKPVEKTAQTFTFAQSRDKQSSPDNILIVQSLSSEQGANFSDSRPFALESSSIDFASRDKEASPVWNYSQVPQQVPINLDRKSYNLYQPPKKTRIPTVAWNSAGLEQPSSDSSPREIKPARQQQPATYFTGIQGQPIKTKQQTASLPIDLNSNLNYFQNRGDKFGLNSADNGKVKITRVPIKKNSSIVSSHIVPQPTWPREGESGPKDNQVEGISQPAKPVPGAAIANSWVYNAQNFQRSKAKKGSVAKQNWAQNIDRSPKVAKEGSDSYTPYVSRFSPQKGQDEAQDPSQKQAAQSPTQPVEKSSWVRKVYWDYQKSCLANLQMLRERIASE